MAGRRRRNPRRPRSRLTREETRKCQARRSRGRPSRKLNLAIGAACLAVLAGSWMLIRAQAAITDEQFLKSMIPHHASAILMCGQAPLSDLAIQRLCKSIVAGQQGEIDLMKRKLDELKRGA